MRNSLKRVLGLVLVLSVLAGLGYATHKLNTQSDRVMATDGRPWP